MKGCEVWRGRAESSFRVVSRSSVVQHEFTYRIAQQEFHLDEASFDMSLAEMPTTH